MALKLTLTGGAELGRLALRLRKMNEPEVGRIFRRQLRVPVRSMASEIHAAIMAIPSKKSGKPEMLRTRLTRCVRVTVRTTAEGGTGAGKLTEVAVFMDPHRMPTGQYALPLTMEGEKIWRHPTFGDDPWVTQSPHPYFGPVVAAHAGDARSAVDRAMEEIKIRVDG